MTVALEGSRLLVYVTRFTEDIFATLISAIFVAESFEFVYRVSGGRLVSLQTFEENPVENFGYYEFVHAHCNGTAGVRQSRLAEARTDLQPSPAPAAAGHAVGVAPCSPAEPNTALLTAIIMFCTFVLAFLLKKLRESFYLGRQVSELPGPPCSAAAESHRRLRRAHLHRHRHDCRAAVHPGPVLTGAVWCF